jgi:pimeloyl-ACP methyl ester carboxylesterase
MQHRRNGLFLVAASLLGCHAHRSGVEVAGFRFMPATCAPALAEAHARCGTVAVPEDAATPAGRRIDLNVIVFDALEPGSERAAQFDLEGGPGFAVTDSAAFYAGDGIEYRRHRDVVLFDMRGTGASNPLRCPALEQAAQADPPAPLYPPELVARCAAELGARADLRQYTTAAAARDIDAVRAALGYERIDLNALSYGTTLALRYIADYPRRVRSAVLTGTVPADRTPPRHHAPAAERALGLLLQACADEPDCAQHYPALDGQLARASSSLEPVQRAMFMEKLRTLMYLPPSARRIPQLIHDAAAGNPEALKPGKAGGRPFADGSYLSITCSESLARMDVDAAIAASETTRFGAYRLRRQRDACARWPVAPADPRLFARPRTDVPVLFFSGLLDPVSPPEWTAALLADFPNGRHVVVPKGGHVLEDMSGLDTCMDTMILKFVATLALDAGDSACVASMDAGSFVLP